MTATQSSTYANAAEKFGAGNCIDGNTSSDLGPEGRYGRTYAICQTSRDAAPWIAVDYGTSVAVERVEIFNRGTSGRRTRNVEVRVSDSLPTSGSRMFSGGILVGRFAGPATDGQHIIISGQRLLTSGRYVIVQMDNGGDVLNLREVKAFGRLP